MTSLLERAISVITPCHCISCSKESNVLCEVVSYKRLAMCRNCVFYTINLRTNQEVTVPAQANDVSARADGGVRAAYKPLAAAVSKLFPIYGSVGLRPAKLLA